MTTSKATDRGIEYALKHFAKRTGKAVYAYNIWDGEQWIGAVVFCETETKRFDKWPGQVFEMIVAVSMCHDAAVTLGVDCLKCEVPLADAVISREAAFDFSHIGKFGNGKQGAYIVDGERLHRTTVRGNGWRDSVLWLRENIDPAAYQFDREAEDLWIYPLNEQMADRIKVL